MSDFLKLKSLIENHNRFILSTHVNPDADALGSQLAFFRILKKLGKKAWIINHSSTPYNLQFLDEENVIEKFDEKIHSQVINEAQIFFLLDLNQAERIVKMEKSLRNFKGLKVCIDHHLNSENIFDHIFGGDSYCATAEIVYDFIDETKIVDLDFEIALNLYAGIMTDTGSFRFDRTSPKIHRIMAILLEKGVNPTDVYDKIFDQFNFGRVKLLGYALGGMQLDSTKQISYMTVTRKMLVETGSSEADVDGFVNYCLTVKGVKIGILFYELNDGIKVSFRSKGEIAVNKLALQFGGGGHLNAAGIRFTNTKLEEIKEKIIDAAKLYL